MPPAVPRPQELRTAVWGRSRQACRCLAEGCGTILIGEPTPNQTGLPAPGPAPGERRASPGTQRHIPPRPFELLMSSTPSTADGYQCGRSWAQLDAPAVPEVPNLPRISIALAKVRRRLRALSCRAPGCRSQLGEQCRSSGAHHPPDFSFLLCRAPSWWQSTAPRPHTQQRGRGCQPGAADGSHASWCRAASPTVGSGLLRATHGASSGPIPPRGHRSPDGVLWYTGARAWGRPCSQPARGQPWRTADTWPWVCSPVR